MKRKKEDKNKLKFHIYIFMNELPLLPILGSYPFLPSLLYLNTSNIKQDDNKTTWQNDHKTTRQQDIKTTWQNYHKTTRQQDNMTTRQDKTTWQYDNMTTWQHDNMTTWQHKTRPQDNLIPLIHDNLTTWQHDTMNTWHQDKMTIWQQSSNITQREILIHDKTIWK